MNCFFLISLAPKRADYEPEKRNASHLVEMDDVVEKELYAVGELLFSEHLTPFQKPLQAEVNVFLLQSPPLKLPDCQIATQARDCVAGGRTDLGQIQWLSTAGG